MKSIEAAIDGPEYPGEVAEGGWAVVVVVVVLLVPVPSPQAALGVGGEAEEGQLLLPPA